MNIDKYADSLKQLRGTRGFAFLAQRVPQSNDAPYRIAAMDEAIRPDDAVVLVLGGSGDGTNIEGHNGLLKYVTNFIRSKPELNNAKVCIAVLNFGTEYPQALGRHAFMFSKRYAFIWYILQKCAARPMKKLYDSLPALDIYNSVILPKITDGNGARLDTDTMLKNIRGITIMAYCAGGHTAMHIEEVMLQQMPQIGYSKSEIKMALHQMPVIGYAMGAPYRKSNMRFLSFESMGELERTPSAFNNFLCHQDFGMIHLSYKNSDAFYCTSVSKVGIEGNSNVLYAIPMDEYMEQRDKECHPDHVESKTDTFSEHTFIGFVAKDGYSIGATNLQTVFKNVLVNATKNSIENSNGKKFISLPPISELVDNGDLLNAANAKRKQMRKKYMPDFALWQLYTATKNIKNMIRIHKLTRDAQK